MKELKIRYRYVINKYLTGLEYKKLKFFFMLIRIKKDISINKILAKDIDEPATIEIGNKENKTRK
tara:strand:- start:224 stop:418 length:195 start_codon:yes stop_codon:yes gene_type:complete